MWGRIHKVRDLLRKYQTILALRQGRTEVAPKATLQALAAEFPGALRELDRISMELLEMRIVELEQVVAGGPDRTWMRVQNAFHALLRQERAHRRRPQGEAVARYAIRMLAASFEQPEGQIRDWVFPTSSRPAKK